MPTAIEDYAVIGDCQTAALVSRGGSIDWLCLPRFDSGACFAALLGTEQNGCWVISPMGEIKKVERHYCDGTLVLETEYETDEGRVALVDCMPLRARNPAVVRLVVGRRGEVRMHMQLAIRFDYGSIVPWVRRTDWGIHAIGGPDAVALQTNVPLQGEGFTTKAEFTVTEGSQVPFVLTWHRAHEAMPGFVDAEQTIQATQRWWQKWSERCEYRGPWRNAVSRSLITLKALTYAPTGGIVAAPTTSLPEKLGGVRNWDYRFCWIRDATFTLYALTQGGYIEEACAWREWLLRAVAGKPSDLDIMYGLAGERRLTELELEWLPGYENSKPARIGNAAHRQYQLDIYGEVIDTFHLARRSGLQPSDEAWRVQRALVEFLESGWKDPDEGIWEVRGPRRHFTHSKIMAWVAVDRTVKTIERFGFEGPVERWRKLREHIHREACEKGFDPEQNSFVQFYGGKELDASLLMIPLVGFLPAQDRRVRGTVEAIVTHLNWHGLVVRYNATGKVDGLPAGEGVFLPCSFWLADNYALLGRTQEAIKLFERLLDLRNDVGLLSEEYDPQTRRLLGNFPQAFSHVSLVNTANNLSRGKMPAEDRGKS